MKKLLLFLFLISFVFVENTYAKDCCPKKYQDTDLDVYWNGTRCSVRGGRGQEIIPILCDSSTEVCTSAGQCISGEDAPLPGENCGALNQNCCVKSSRELYCTRSNLKCNQSTNKCEKMSEEEEGGEPVGPEEIECQIGGSTYLGIDTALGCIPTDPKGLIGWILKYAVSMGGGIAFLLMVWGGFLLSTSSGNPERVKQGQEILTSAIVGLLFIIFSVFLLQFVGVDILKIPGFER